MNLALKKSDLNFKVYTVPSKPTTAGAENDIAIISSVPMTNWIMSPEKPSGIPRTDGDVWIQYSTQGDTFNVLKQNALMIATISAWQYVDGSWLGRGAVSCQGGVWVEWVTVLWDASKNYENLEVLGNKGFYITNNNNYDSKGTLSKESDGMVLHSHAADNIVFVSHDNIIDFNGVSKITVTWSGGSDYQNYQGIGIYSKNNPSANTEAIAYLHKDNTSSETATLIVENVNQKGYVVISAYNANLKVTNITYK